MRTALVLLAGIGPMLLPRTAGSAPSYDHIVIVVEENHSFGQVIGSSTAPYINQLADQGMLFTNFYGILHPSQPNYLELFSGDNQGVFNDTVPPAGVPFTTPNLAAELIAAGKTFRGYAESLPAAGDTVGSSGDYRRRHAPWVDWLNTPAGANQLSPTLHQPFTSYPAGNFDALPNVSFVIPNLQHDMHNGTVNQADVWLKQNLSAYAEWAKTHNSLLVVTWDEDNFSTTNHNRIPTIFYGANVQQGQSDVAYTLHNLLRTVEDLNGLATHAGRAAQVQPINGAFVGDPAAATVRFQQGVAGYSAVHDLHVRQDAPTSSFANVTPLIVDLDDNGAAGDQPVQALVRFDNLFGPAAAQVPAGRTIVSAKLVFETDTDASKSTIELHRMLKDWGDTTTWNSLGGGVKADGVTAATQAEFTVTPSTANTSAIFDVTETVRQWQAGAPNQGWALLAAGGDGWHTLSSEAAAAAVRPWLEITFAYPTSWRVDSNGNWSQAANWNPGVASGPESTAYFTGAISAPRTITLDAPQTVGAVIFDNLSTYTIAGAATLTLQGVAHNATLHVVRGQHAITAPVALASDLLVTGAAGTSLRLGGGISGVGTTLINNDFGWLELGGDAQVSSVRGAGNLRVTGSLTTDYLQQGRLELVGKAALRPEVAAPLSTLSGLTFAGGQIDLADHPLLVQATTATRQAVLESLTSQLALGFHGGKWDGPGIVSSVAAADAAHLAAVGILLNRKSNGQPVVTTWNGAAVDASSILLAYTYYGDANLDGVVDGIDYSFIDNGYNLGLTGWSNGDFNYDGVVDGTDYALIDNAFNFQQGPLGSPLLVGVPEPSSHRLLLAAAGALALAACWRGRHARLRRDALQPR